MTQDELYWIDFLLHFRIFSVLCYNMLYQIGINTLAMYIITEYVIDMSNVFLRYDTSAKTNLYTFIHHFFVIASVYNEYVFNFTSPDNFIKRTTACYMLLGFYDLIGYSQIVFKHIDISCIVNYSAYLRYVSSIVLTMIMLIHLITPTLNNFNWFNYLALCFNNFTVFLIWYYGPCEIFANPHRNTKPILYRLDT